MGLTDDQRAMLRLLAQREEGYEDIAALKGISIEDVRAEVKAALAALERDDASPAAGPAVREKPETSPAAGPVAGEGGALRAEQAPSSTPPTPAPSAEERSGSASASPRAAAAPAPPRAGKSRSWLPRERRRLGELIGGALVVLLIVLFATDTVNIGGGDDSDSDGSATAGQIAAPASGKQPTQAVLEAVDGSDASGQALFGRLKNQVVLAIAAKGLDPSPAGQSYAISLVRSPEERVPIAAAKVGKSGEIGGQYPIAPNVLGLLAGGYDEMEVSLVVNKELRSALAKAQQEEATPSFEGAEFLRGPVTGPIVSGGD